MARATLALSLTRRWTRPRLLSPPRSARLKPLLRILTIFFFFWITFSCWIFYIALTGQLDMGLEFKKKDLELMTMMMMTENTKGLLQKEVLC
jgi:hypothetical protein